MEWRYLGLLALVPLLLSGTAVASGPSISSPSYSPPSALSLSLVGGINSVATQAYSLGQHGSADYAAILGFVLNPSSTHLDYSLSAVVAGLDVHGSASLRLTGMESDGERVTVSGQIKIQGMVAAETFEDSAIPSAFTGVFTGLISLGESARFVTLPLTMESPFVNPFGEPIVVASLDSEGSIVLVTGYQTGKIVYNNVQVFGVAVAGNVGTTPVTSGNAVLSTSAIENLFTGREIETGSISFVGMSPSYLDSSGFYFGSTVIPGPSDCLSTYGFSPCTVDCTAELLYLLVPENLLPTVNINLPYSTGLCTITGFISSGVYFTSGPGALIFGRYLTVWDIPAVSFGITSIGLPTGGSTITGVVFTK